MYVVKNVLESKLGCKVKITQIAEIPVYQALPTGKVDAVLEDWQHVAQYTQYEQKLKIAQDAGSNGVTGHIGWYMPTYVVKQHPEMKTWKGLRRTGRSSRPPSPAAGDVARRRSVVREDGRAADQELSA